MRSRELSRRQLECLEGRRQRLTAKQIGRKLNISHNTVTMHCRLARLKIESADMDRADRGGTRQQTVTRSIFSWRDFRQVDWSALTAAAALVLAGALSIVFLLAAASVAVVHSLSLSFQKPFYNLFG